MKDRSATKNGAFDGPEFRTGLAPPREATAADVAYLSQLLLGREASPAEFKRYIGLDLLNVVTELATSTGHRDSMRNALAEDVVLLYRVLLQREPESEEVVSHRVGRPLLDVVADFARSDELRARAQVTTAADVRSLYQHILGRQPESEDAVASRLGLPLLSVAMDVFLSAEARAIHGVDVGELQELCALFLESPVDERWARELVEILRSYRLGRLPLLAHLLRMHRRRLKTNDASAVALEPALSLREHPDYEPTRHFGTAITLIVPTINSEGWIQEVIDFYESIPLSPLYVVDSRTRDRTCEILAKANQNWIKVSSRAPRVESLLPGILARINSPWVLRLDDDELPAPGLLRFCDEVVDRNETPVWGFPRLCLRWQPGRSALDYSTFLTVGPAVDMNPQFRLFRADCVTLKDEVHTPGFDSTFAARAPSRALLLHFDWILRTAARRRDKAASYDAQAGEGLHPRNFVYEDVPEDWHLFESLAHPRFVDFARRIYQKAC